MTRNTSEIILFGDSHLSPLFNLRASEGDNFGQDLPFALKLQWVDNGMIVYDFMLSIEGRTYKTLNPIVQVALDQAGVFDRYTHQWLRKEVDLYFCLGFAESHLIGFHDSWNRYCIEGDGVDHPNLQCLPRSLMVETVRERLSSFAEGLELLIAAGYRVGILSGPPPHARNELIMKSRVENFLAAPSTRLAVYQCTRDAIAAEAARIGASFLSVDSATADAEGFLREEFEADGVHANAEFARTVIGLMAKPL